jgi:hypothetical protein
LFSYGKHTFLRQTKSGSKDVCVSMQGMKSSAGIILCLYAIN